MRRYNFDTPYRSQRIPTVAHNIVATSQPLAAQAGIRALKEGGNAVDAALAAAITLTVVEPTANGVGSDAFAIVHDGDIHGLNASGRSPACWTTEHFRRCRTMPPRGWDSVTVPGAVSAWVALSERFGRLPFPALFREAIQYARGGFPVSPLIASTWARIAPRYVGQSGFNETFLPKGRAPLVGEIFRNPDLADTLAAIAETKGKVFYEGEIAKLMAAEAAAGGGGITLDDLASHAPTWCGTVSCVYQGGEVHEIPPNTQGIAALMSLRILETFDLGAMDADGVESIHLQIEATKLALADTDAFVADADSMEVSPESLLDPDYLATRRNLIDRRSAGLFAAGAPRTGGTVYVAAADAAGMMVSYIQSNYEGFGSGVVVRGTGVSLQNRGIGFVLTPGHPNQVGPRKRPAHTIIPGFFTRNGKADMSFGVMGGPMQAQGHIQMVIRTQLYGQNPQTASDAPRWRFVSGRRVVLEAGSNPKLAEGLRTLGHEIELEPPDASWGFGGAQLICRLEEGYVAGSDHRKDGLAAGF